MSEFVAEAAKEYLDSEVKPGTIELQGFGAKRVFKGNELYGEENRDNQIGVYLTAKGAIVYWSFVPMAINPDEAEEFVVYRTLEELFNHQDWLVENKNRRIKSTIQQEYVALTRRSLVENLDI